MSPPLKPCAAVGDTEGDYHERPRLDIVDVARKQGLSGAVLDVGCAGGILGELLVDRGLARSVVGVEADPEVGLRASRRLTRVVIGDASQPDVFESVGGPFDAMIFADVLEHTVDPLPTLRRYVSLLVPGGLCIISLPNVRYYRVVADLVVKNEWTYRDEGVLDRTHLRFFTFPSAQRLCVDVGLRVLEAYGPLTPRGLRIGRAVPFLVSFLTSQLILVCRADTAVPVRP